MMMQAIRDFYIAQGAVVTGDVVCGPGVNIWFGTVIRGDLARITLGAVNLQDGCVVHTDYDAPLVIEEGVVAGHRAILHGARIGHGTLVGMGAILLSGSDVGAECLIAAGSIVTEGKVIPPRSVVMGIPGKVVRQVTEDDLNRSRSINAHYHKLAQRYVDGTSRRPGNLSRLPPIHAKATAAQLTLGSVGDVCPFCAVYTIDRTAQVADSWAPAFVSAGKT